MSQPYFVWVELQVAPENRARFLELVKENAARSVADEPGCSRFDVLEAPDGGAIGLYEIYDDEAAFQAHLTTPHYHAFNEGTKDLIADKLWRQFSGTEYAKK